MMWFKDLWCKLFWHKERTISTGREGTYFSCARCRRFYYRPHDPLLMLQLALIDIAKNRNIGDY